MIYYFYTQVNMKKEKNCLNLCECGCDEYHEDIVEKEER